VHRWKSERPDLPTDEFVDDIPYPETQTYVKKILGTADDYRRLYGSATTVEGVETSRQPSVPTVSAAPKKAAPPARKSAKKPAPKKPTTTKR